MKSETAFHDLVRLAAQICEVPTSIIFFREGEKLRVKAKVGWKGTEIPRQDPFCQFVSERPRLFVVHDILKDRRLAGSCLVSKAPRVRFAGGAPLLSPEGDLLGIICVMDSSPRKLNRHQISALEALSSQVISLLQLEQCQSRLKAMESQSRQTEEETLRTLYIRYLPLLEQLPFSIQIFTPDGWSLHVNRAWEELWDTSREALTLHNYNILNDEQLVAKEIMPYVKKAFGGAAVRVPPVLYAPAETGYHTARPRWLGAFIFPIKNEDETIKCVVCVHEDVTEQKKAECTLLGTPNELQIRIEAQNAQLRRINEALETELRARVQAEDEILKLSELLTRSNQELEEFAFSISHDLQGPLGAIWRRLDTLTGHLQEKLDSKAIQLITLMSDELLRVRRLINDLLAYSRVGTGERKFQPTDCQIVLEIVCGNLRPLMDETGAMVTFDPMPLITANETLLIQLFQNLIGNAIKFHGKDPPVVHIGVEHRPGFWLFRVRDNGLGIDRLYWESIFSIFQRAHEDEGYPGTGIGLAICKKIVGWHKGEIWVESEPGKGSTFYFTISEEPG